jgi:hypothetical protein
MSVEFSFGPSNKYRWRGLPGSWFTSYEIRASEGDVRCIEGKLFQVYTMEKLWHGIKCHWTSVDKGDGYQSIRDFKMKVVNG